MKKLTKLSICLIIVQTILTFGTNWINFFMFYAIEKNALIDDSSDRRSILRGISYVVYMVVMMFLSGLFVLNLYHPFYLLSSYSYNIEVIGNHLFLFISIYITLSYSFYYIYKFILKSIYLILFRRQKNEIWMYIQYVISFVGKVFLLGIYEMYAYLINRYDNKKKYHFTFFGKFSLSFMILLLSINLIFVLINITIVPPILLYLVMISFINPFLNYGLYELKLRLILKNDLSLFGNEELQEISNKYNKLVYLFMVIMIGVFIIQLSFIPAKNNNLTKEDLTINIADLNCNEDYSLCVKDNQTLENPFRSRLLSNVCVNSSFEKCDSLRQEIRGITLSYHNPDKIDPTPIIYTDRYNNLDDNTVYKSEGVLYHSEQYKNYYIYSETYYKKVENTYIPLFNVIKNFYFIINARERLDYLSLDFAVDMVEFDCMVFENEVYIYSFLDHQMKLYESGLINIDTSRLILDQFNIEVESNQNILTGYKAEIRSKGLVASKEDGLSHFDTWTTGYVLASFDPLMISSLIFNASNYIDHSRDDSHLHYLYDIRNNQYDLNQIQYPFDTKFIYLKDSEELFFSYDRSVKNVYLTNVRNAELYINEQGAIKKCYWDNYVLYEDFYKKCLDNVDYTNKVNIQELSKVDRVVFKDGYFSITFYKTSDEETMGLVTFELKTIQQYYQSGNIKSEQIIVDPY